MTGEPGPPQPNTERVGGASSARLATLLAMGLLIGVVWFGLAGRADTPSPEPSAQAALPTPPAASPRPAESEHPPAEAAAPTPPRSPGPALHHGEISWGNDAFGVSAWIEGRFYFGVLRETSPGHLQSAFRLPLVDSRDPAELELFQLWTRDQRSAYAPVDTYQLPPGWLTQTEAREVLHAEQPGEPGSASPRLVRQGYTLSVVAEPQADHSIVVVDVLLREPSRPPPSRPNLQGRLLSGDRLQAFVGLGGRPADGPLTGHLLFYGRYGSTVELQLVRGADPLSDTAELAEEEVLVSLELERRLLRRGHPEQLQGEFSLAWPEPSEAHAWRYRITPTGTGSGILLVLEVEPVDYEVLETALRADESGTERLIRITRGWQDFGRRDGAPRIWTCWSEGQTC